MKQPQRCSHLCIKYHRTDRGNCNSQVYRYEPLDHHVSSRRRLHTGINSFDHNHIPSGRWQPFSIDDHELSLTVIAVELHPHDIAQDQWLPRQCHVTFGVDAHHHKAVVEQQYHQWPTGGSTHGHKFAGEEDGPIRENLLGMKESYIYECFNGYRNIIIMRWFVG